MRSESQHNWGFEMVTYTEGLQLVGNGWGRSMDVVYAQADWPVVVS